MHLNTDHFERCIKTLENSLTLSRPQANLSELREALSESNLPILVDLLDWARIPESFRREIVRGGTVPVQSGLEAPALQKEPAPPGPNSAQQIDEGREE